MTANCKIHDAGLVPVPEKKKCYKNIGQFMKSGYERYMRSV